MRSLLMLCKQCFEEKHSHNFVWRSDRKCYRNICKSCHTKNQKKRYTNYKVKSPFKCRATKIKAKCKHKKIKYDLTYQHLESIWTGKCPVFGFKIKFNEHRNSERHAELDRINPKKSYTKGNVIWLSRRANRIKNNAIPKDLLLLAEWLQNVTIKS